MTIKIRAVLAAAAACTALNATALHAETLRYAIGFPPGGAVTDGIAEFNEKLQAETDMALKVYELSLLDLKETPPGVRDGLADAGYVLTPYYPAEFSESNLPANMSMLATVGTPTKIFGGGDGRGDDGIYHAALRRMSGAVRRAESAVHGGHRHAGICSALHEPGAGCRRYKRQENAVFCGCNGSLG